MTAARQPQTCSHPIYECLQEPTKSEDNNLLHRVPVDIDT